MKLPFRGAGVILLVLVLCLAVLGVGYGKWTDRLTVKGDMTTAASALIVGWYEGPTSDGGSQPDDTCFWDWETNRHYTFVDGWDNLDAKDVGRTTSNLKDPPLVVCPGTCPWILYQTLEVTMENVYPCYAVKVHPSMANYGPMRAKIVGWTVYPDWGDPAGYTWTWDPLANQGSGAYVCPNYPLGFDPNRPYNISFEDGGGLIVLPPECATSHTFELVVHVEQPAEQNRGDLDGDGLITPPETPPYTFQVVLHAEPVL